MTFSVNGTTVITTDRIIQLKTGATGSRPGSPTTGQLFYDTTLGKLIVWNGSAWKESVTSGPSPPLWCWGGNYFGRLGDGTTTNRNSPVTVVGGFTDWVQIDAGGAHTAAVRANGQAWCWGLNNYGQLGDNTTTSRLSPVSVIGGITDWVQISAGGSHTVAIRANGQAWCWGFNLYGQLGDGTTTHRSSPISVVGGITDWVQISAGNGHNAAIRSNGQAWCWGGNIGGRLGDNSTSNRNSPVSVAGGFTDWVQISAGYLHTAAIRSNGQAWCWGRNTSYQLGDGSVTERSSPVSVIGGVTNWVQISAGSVHTSAIRANGTAWGWGGNYFGRLGDGTQTGRNSPVSVVGGFTDWIQISAAKEHTVAIRANGQARSWGRNFYGRLGDGTTTNRSSPVSVLGGFTDWVQISAGNEHSAAIRSQPRTQTARPTTLRNTF